MSENEWENMPVIQQEKPFPEDVDEIEESTQQASPGYKRDMNIGLKMSKGGKPEVDLSSISPQDIADIKALSGV
jgi:hypothetical protein